MSERRCPKCLAINPVDALKCVKCGFQLPLPVKNGPLRSTVKFSQINLFYSKPKQVWDEEGLLVDVETEFRLYRAYRELKQSPLIIFDSDGYVNQKNLEYALVKPDAETVLRIIKSTPQSLWLKILRQYHFNPSEEDKDKHPVEKIWAAGFLVTPVPRLRNVEFLRDMDWREYVEGIIAFKGVNIDPRLKLVRRAHLMRGIKQSINPHALVILPGQTGKSDWYYYVGVCETKVSANSLIGYADADGPVPGSVDGSELPFALDQIESSGLYTIFRYMLGLMETGEAVVDMAAHPFTIRSLSPFAILSNPIGEPKSDFAVILDKLTKNPTAGRRFGIILYDKDAVRIAKRERDIELLRQEVQLFRAVEEYALPEIKKIIYNVWDWLNERNEELVRQAIKAIEPIQDENQNLYLFLREFIENGGTHTRGGALRAALAMNLDKIALKEYNIDDILSEAEEYLHDLLEINYKSIQLIAATYQETREQADLRAFDMLPTYMKEIVSAIELWRRSLTDAEKQTFHVPLNFYLNTLNYTPRTADYFSEILKIAKKGNPEKYNEILREHFQFEIKKESNGLMAWIYSVASIPHLKVLDNLDNLTNFEEGKIEKNAKNNGAATVGMENNASSNIAKKSKLSKMSKNVGEETAGSGKNAPSKRLQESYSEGMNVQNVQGAPDDLKTIGFLNFSDFSISQSPQRHPPNEQRELNAGGEGKSEMEDGEGVSENIEKLRKLRNGEKWTENLSEPIAGTCVKWRTKDCPAAVPTAIFPDAKCPLTCPAYEPRKEEDKRGS